MSLNVTSLARPKGGRTGRERGLLDAAFHLFVGKGFAATKTAEITARAGVSKGALYLYYKSKEELLEAVISAYLFEVPLGYSARTNVRQRGLRTLTFESLMEWSQRLYDGPASAVIKLVVAEARNFPDLAKFYEREAIGPVEAHFSGVIQQGIAAGEFRPVDVASAVQSLLTPILMLCLQKHSVEVATTGARRMDFAAFVRQHVELILGGLSSAAFRERRLP